MAHGSTAPQKLYTCYRCGGTDGHTATECGAINSRCNSCKKVGQLQKVCRSKPKGSDLNWIKQRSPKKDKKRTSKIRNLRAKSWFDESSDNENQPVLSFNNADSSITVKLNGQGTRMIIDTGCKYNIISSKLYLSQFKNYKLNTTEKHFTAYGQKETIKM